MKNIILTTLYYFLNALQILILIRVIISWLPIGSDNPIIGFIRQVTDPILTPIRSLIEKSIFGGKGMMLDFSPIIAYFFIYMLQNFVTNLMR